MRVCCSTGMQIFSMSVSNHESTSARGKKANDSAGIGRAWSGGRVLKVRFTPFAQDEWDFCRAEGAFRSVPNHKVGPRKTGCTGYIDIYRLTFARLFEGLDEVWDNNFRPLKKTLSKALRCPQWPKSDPKAFPNGPPNGRLDAFRRKKTILRKH